jgi:hypothetical protein
MLLQLTDISLVIDKYKIIVRFDEKMLRRIIDCEETALKGMYRNETAKYKLLATLIYSKEYGQDCIDTLQHHNINEIGISAFSWCNKLNNITLSSGLTRIDNYAFKNCNSLESIILPDSLTFIGEYAFSSCMNLRNIIIPKNVTSIGLEAFYQNGLENFSVSIDNNTYKSIDGVLFNKEGTNLICYPINNIRNSYEIPKGVETISTGAFFLSTLNDITIPDSIKTIESSAFCCCENLTNLTILSITPPALGNNVFLFDLGYQIFVQSQFLNDYKNNWSDEASRIFAIA